MEEGKPLDLSQLMGQKKSLQEQIEENIDTIRYQAEQGKAEYQNLYGICYENGWGVGQDVKEAFKWYTKAADQLRLAMH